MTLQEISQKIDSVGNIRVIFEPESYNENHFSKKDLRSIIEKSQVSLRGWSFPHIPIEDQENSQRPYSIENGIEFYTAWEKFFEIFRFYQSGQFLAKFALYEDTIGRLNDKVLEPGKYLDFMSTIYKITEIVFFIKNLMESTDINRGNLIINIYQTRNRQLQAIFSPNIIPLYGGYVCKMGSISITKSFSREKIISDYIKIAREIIKNIFEDFNWMDYSDNVIKTHQENLLNRKI